MYWEKRFPRLLSTKQLQELMKNGCPLVGVSDITCDIGGSLEFVNNSTSIEKPFFRWYIESLIFVHIQVANAFKSLLDYFKIVSLELSLSCFVDT